MQGHQTDPRACALHEKALAGGEPSVGDHRVMTVFSAIGSVAADSKNIAGGIRRMRLQSVMCFGMGGHAEAHDPVAFANIADL